MPKISVVMAVHNGSGALRRTLDSIFGQSERDFELIVVDDGSTDETADVLREAARLDSRLRVVTQHNTGLTGALVRGCSEATASVIARHDCGDQSHPERFHLQLERLGRDPSAILVSCFTRFEGPGGEFLYVSEGDGDSVRGSLLSSGVESIRSLTHHGSAMFLREAYEKAGGYRTAFTFAQDLDLWIRMAPMGSLQFVPEVLYTARIEESSISALRRPEQIELATIALRMRDQPGKRADLLAQAEAVGRRVLRANNRSLAAGNYFIASCLRRNGDSRWRAYASRAVRFDPTNLRAWLLLSGVRR